MGASDFIFIAWVIITICVAGLSIFTFSVVQQQGRDIETLKKDSNGTTPASAMRTTADINRMMRNNK
jgi:hypothetical protein